MSIAKFLPTWLFYLYFLTIGVECTRWVFDCARWVFDSPLSHDILDKKFHLLAYTPQVAQEVKRIRHTKIDKPTASSSSHHLNTASVSSSGVAGGHPTTAAMFANPLNLPHQLTSALSAFSGSHQASTLAQAATARYDSTPEVVCPCCKSQLPDKVSILQLYNVQRNLKSLVYEWNVRYIWQIVTRQCLMSSILLFTRLIIIISKHLQEISVHNRCPPWRQSDISMSSPWCRVSNLDLSLFPVVLS